MKVKLLSHVRLFGTPWTVAYQAPPSMGFYRKEYWNGLPFLLQGIFLTQGLNLGLSYCRQMLYHLSHQGSPKYSVFNNYNLWNACFLPMSTTEYLLLHGEHESFFNKNEHSPMPICSVPAQIGTYHV